MWGTLLKGCSIKTIENHCPSGFPMQILQHPPMESIVHCFEDKKGNFIMKWNKGKECKLESQESPACGMLVDSVQVQELFHKK